MRMGGGLMRIAHIRFHKGDPHDHIAGMASTGRSEPEARGTGAFKPHMHRQPDETVQQWCSRLARSCYRCGEQYADAAALRLHEDRFGLTSKAGARSEVGAQTVR